MKLDLTTGPAHLKIIVDPPAPRGQRRKVWLQLSLATGDTLMGMSACDLRDQFVRWIGRKRAAERLLYGGGNGWEGAWAQIGPPSDPHRRKCVPLVLAEKTDRAALWAAVLGPKFAHRRAAVASVRELAHA